MLPVMAFLTSQLKSHHRAFIFGSNFFFALSRSIIPDNIAIIRAPVHLDGMACDSSHSVIHKSTPLSIISWRFVGSGSISSKCIMYCS